MIKRFKLDCVFYNQICQLSCLLFTTIMGNHNKINVKHNLERYTINFNAWITEEVSVSLKSLSMLSSLEMYSSLYCSSMFVSFSNCRSTSSPSPHQHQQENHEWILDQHVALLQVVKAHHLGMKCHAQPHLLCYQWF